VRWSATWEGRFPLTNELLGRNRIVIRNAVSPMREFFTVAARGTVRGIPKAPRFEHAGLIVEVDWKATGRSKIPDPAGAYLVTKEALDALVAEGVLPDDNSDVLTGGEHFLPVKRAGRYALTLTLDDTIQPY
jgi:hypothetical protein